QLWHDILKITKERHISFIVHNGLLDIMYLYQSFIASLPDKLPHFIADVVEMFPAGIYDTKYLATELLNEHKSYLAYLYCKYRRLSLVSSSWSVLAPLSPVLVPSTTHEIESSCQSLNDMTPSMKRRKRMKKQEKNKESKTGICGLYANRGWCKKGKECDLSHDLQIILDHDLGTIQTNKDLNEQPLPGTSTNHNDSLPPPSTDIERRDHSAHFDAYMTAFVFCHFLSTVPLEDLSSHVNKLNLMRMDLPLRLVESHYAKPSTEWIRIKSLLWP
ncbi:CAF1 family ribonuclease-domain-containing protein, partial [Chlamydoabsidia padenii]